MAPPIKFAHVVLKTAKYRAMIDWWCNFLEAEVRHGNEFITFMSYDDEHHRLALINVPDVGDRPRNAAGLEHVAFTYATLDDLLVHYERMRAQGAKPYFMVHHGMTLSAYYRDPDGNQVETQVDALSLDDADAFMNSAVFAANPIGIKVNFDSIVARRRSGESVESLLDYATAGT